MNDVDGRILKQQIEYYRARATEYDEWFLRLGRYDRGEEHRKKWFAELEQVREALSAVLPGGDVLELACGTGLWTSHLLPGSNRIVAVDASPEVLDICRARVTDTRVEFVESDIFTWEPTERFDFIFFGFWLSHVPMSRFDDFWNGLRKTLKPGGTVFFVDGLLTQESTAVNHQALDRSGSSVRKLNDGREFEIVKIFHEPPVLEKRLLEMGWRGEVRTTDEFFYFGAFSIEP